MSGRSWNNGQSHEREGIEQTRQQLAASVQTELRPAIDRWKKGDQSPAYNAHLQATDRAVLQALNGAQRDAWQKLAGELIDEPTRQSIRRAAGQVVRKYAVLRG